MSDDTTTLAPSDSRFFEYSREPTNIIVESKNGERLMTITKEGVVSLKGGYTCESALLEAATLTAQPPVPSHVASSITAADVSIVTLLGLVIGILLKRG